MAVKRWPAGVLAPNGGSEKAFRIVEAPHLPKSFDWRLRSAKPHPLGALSGILPASVGERLTDCPVSLASPAVLFRGTPLIVPSTCNHSDYRYVTADIHHRSGDGDDRLQSKNCASACGLEETLNAHKNSMAQGPVLAGLQSHS
jgi:hypothetical protein